MDPKTKFWLFKQSKHFCAVPWNQFQVFSDGSIKTCTRGKRVGNLMETSIDEILSSPKVLKIKSDLLEDKLNDNCVTCHNLSSGDDHYDLRNHYNPLLKAVDIDYTDLNAFELHSIDLHWDNTCNLKCVYCNPKQSSLIAAEQKISVSKIDPIHIDQIIQMIIKNQFNMKEIYMSGGEPLLIKHNYRLLSSLDNKNIPLRINSNITLAVNSNSVFAEVKKFKNVLWTISADTQGNKFNYIRSGSDWGQVLENLETIKNLGHEIRLNCVFFIANIIDMFDPIEYFITKHGITDITVNKLYDHPAMRARNAPAELKEHSLQRLEHLLNSGLLEKNSNSYFNIARCRRELDQPVESVTGYQDYFDNLDRIRGTNWRNIFPELI
jgi:radical SAM protein with 4Fe4S-binding SPASM domain